MGAATVVLPPETQSMVPPVARVAALSGSELPPVLPPVQPETVMVDDPVMVVQTMELVDQVVVKAFSAVIAPLVEIHTSPIALAGSSMPSPLSVVTDAVKLSAEGSVAASLT